MTIIKQTTVQGEDGQRAILKLQQDGIGNYRVWASEMGNDRPLSFGNRLNRLNRLEAVQAFARAESELKARLNRRRMAYRQQLQTTGKTF